MSTGGELAVNGKTYLRKSCQNSSADVSDGGTWLCVWLPGPLISCVPVTAVTSAVVGRGFVYAWRIDLLFACR